MNNSKSVQDSGGAVMLERIEVNTADNPEYAVIWMHGLGADGHDFEPIVPLLGIPAGVAVKFVFPHALRRPITVNNGAVMRAWYDIMELGSTLKGQDEAGIRHSAALVRDLIDQQIALGIPASKIVLAGFSQGGAMALYAGLRYPAKLAGIMSLSAYMLYPDRLDDEHNAANATTPVFVGHGTQDPMVPFFLGEETRKQLEAGDWPVQWHSYPIPHSVSQPEIVDIGRWLTNLFK